MFLSDWLKLIFGAWVIPILFSSVTLLPLGAPVSADVALMAKTLIPKRCYIYHGTGGGDTDYFKLIIESDNGLILHHKDPEYEPVQNLFAAIRENELLTIKYRESITGNVILGLEHKNNPPIVILSLSDVIAEQKSRHSFVYLIAAIWAAIGTLFMALIWIGSKSKPSEEEKEILDNSEQST